MCNNKRKSSRTWSLIAGWLCNKMLENSNIGITLTNFSLASGQLTFNFCSLSVHLLNFNCFTVNNTDRNGLIWKFGPLAYTVYIYFLWYLQMIAQVDISLLCSESEENEKITHKTLKGQFWRQDYVSVRVLQKAFFLSIYIYGGWGLCVWY